VGTSLARHDLGINLWAKRSLKLLVIADWRLHGYNRASFWQRLAAINLQASYAVLSAGLHGRHLVRNGAFAHAWRYGREGGILCRAGV